MLIYLARIMIELMVTDVDRKHTNVQMLRVKMIMCFFVWIQSAEDDFKSPGNSETSIMNKVTIEIK